MEHEDEQQLGDVVQEEPEDGQDSMPPLEEHEHIVEAYFQVVVDHQHEEDNHVVDNSCMDIQGGTGCTLGVNVEDKDIQDGILVDMAQQQVEHMMVHTLPPLHSVHCSWPWQTWDPSHLVNWELMNLNYQACELPQSYHPCSACW